MSSQNQCKVHPREIERAVNSSCKDLFKYICFECGSYIQFIVLHILRRNEWRWRLSNWGLCFWIVTCILKTFPSLNVCRLTEDS